MSTTWACRRYPVSFYRVINKEELCQLVKPDGDTHLHSCAQRTHKISECLLLPTQAFIQARYRLGAPLPGADKEWKLWGRAIQMYSVGKMAVTIVPAAVGFLLGMPLRAVDHGYRPLISFIDNSKTCSEPSKPILLTPEAPLHLRTVNLALTPTSIASSIDLRSPYQRARELGESFIQDPLAPTFIIAQEGWNEDASYLFCTLMKKKYPFIIHNVAPQIMGMNSGMMVFSQHVIEEVAFEKLEGMLFKHSFPPRGILRIRLHTRRGPLLIYGTHTQSCSGVPEAKARLTQIRQIKARVDRDQALEPGILQIVLGDFNSSEIEEDGVPAPAAEKEVLDTLNSYFHDPFLLDHNSRGRRCAGIPYFLAADNKRMGLELAEPEGSWYFGPCNFTMKPISAWGTSRWFYEQRVNSARYDYILLPKKSPLQGRVESRRIVVKKGCQSAPSDHTPVDGRFWLS